MNAINRRAILTLLGGGVALSAFAPAWAQSKDEAPADSVEYATGDRVYGDPDAPVTIYEYASFTCPHCRDFHTQVFPQIDENYIKTGKAKLIYREVYFDGPGLLAGSLARCVPEDKYIPMVKALYADAETWLLQAESLEDITVGLSKLGVLAGLDKDTIAACLDNRELQNAMIETSQKNMSADGITGTPTLVVDGEVVKKWAYDNLSAKIDEQVPEDFVVKAER